MHRRHSNRPGTRFTRGSDRDGKRPFSDADWKGLKATRGDEFGVFDCNWTLVGCSKASAMPLTRTAQKNSLSQPLVQLKTDDPRRNQAQLLQLMHELTLVLSNS